MTHSRSRHFLESCLVLLVIIGLARLAHELGALAWFKPYVAVSVAIFLVYVALIHARLRKEPIDYLDRSVAAWLKSLQWFFGITVLIIPLFLIANHFWQDWVVRTVLIPHAISDLGSVVVYHLFLVAFPEELFFRGWLQNRLNAIATRPWKIFGVPLGWSWLVTALLFAFAHSLIAFQWWHFSIFFPALVFGWLREKTGSITAPILFHALSNLAAEWIAISYV